MKKPEKAEEFMHVLKVPEKSRKNSEKMPKSP